MWATLMYIICSVLWLLSLHFVFVLQLEQDSRLLFGKLTANKFLEKWPTSIKAKVITESHGLVFAREHGGSEICERMLSQLLWMKTVRLGLFSIIIIVCHCAYCKCIYYILIIGLQAGTVTCQPFWCSFISCHHQPRAGRGLGRCQHVRQWYTSSNS